MMLLRTLAAAFATFRGVPADLESHMLPDTPPSASAVDACPGPVARAAEVVAAASPDGFRHRALFCDDRGEYLSVLRRSIQASRARAEAVLLAVPQHTAQLVRRDLGDGSAVTLLDLSELGRNPARIIPAFLTYAAEHRDRRVCCISEPIWGGRSAAEALEATRHEALINLAFRDSNITALCLYDIADLPESVIADAARTHPAIIKDRQEAASPTYLAPPELPLRSNLPLPQPPADAATLDYGCDLGMVRSFVARRAKRAGLSVPRIADLLIAVSELAGNTLRHTADAGTVQVWHTADEIICQVDDTGQIIDPLAGQRPLSEGLLAGNGLWLVNQVSDLVQVRTGVAGTTTRVHMRLRPPRDMKSPQTRSSDR
jgi:anti-sigma regulatory factor (Ser/Thr protein kinase)